MICVGREEEWKYMYILQEHVCIEDTTLEMKKKEKGNIEVEFREV
jgi:hypothetical protein